MLYYAAHIQATCQQYHMNVSNITISHENECSFFFQYHITCSIKQHHCKCDIAFIQQFISKKLILSNLWPASWSVFDPSTKIFPNKVKAEKHTHRGVWFQNESVCLNKSVEWIINDSLRNRCRHLTYVTSGVIQKVKSRSLANQIWEPGLNMLYKLVYTLWFKNICMCQKKQTKTSVCAFLTTYFSPGLGHWLYWWHYECAIAKCLDR